MRIYTNSEDGLYGPAVDNNFATNKWVYLYYSPQTVTNVKLSDGSIVTQTTPNTTAPNVGGVARRRGIRTSATSSSRASSSSRTPRAPAHLDLASEQQILRVSNNRQECCHVAGDIDFDKHNNLWMVTGDDTPAGGINADGYGPFKDQLTDEQQTVRATNATGGTFTLTFNGQTTAPIAYNATARADRRRARGAVERRRRTTSRPAAARSTRRTSTCSSGARCSRPTSAQITGNGAGLTGTDADRVATATTQEGGWYQRPTGDDRRSTLNTNDLRGKILRIKVKDDDITAADANKADLGTGTGAYTIPAGNLFPLRRAARRRPRRGRDLRDGLPQPVPHPGRRERRRVRHRLLAGLATRRSAAAARQASAASRSCASRPTTAIRICYSSDLGYYQWNFHEFAPGTTTVGTPLDNPPQPIDCGDPTACSTTRAGCVDGGPGFEPGLALTPPVTRSGHLVLLPRQQRRGAARHAVLRLLRDDRRARSRPGSTTECPRLFPELYTGGVGPHGAAKYHYDPANPNTKKFPPYYDNSVILGEFTPGHAARGQARLAEPRVQDQQLPGLRRRRTSPTRRSRSSATTRWTCSSARTARSTC